ncbi:hypothetical protein J6590_017278 [Homalodisca vitripennis]|nr:hypothetical protein J6590_017278 [Homalodisca vitripennis]
MHQPRINSSLGSINSSLPRVPRVVFVYLSSQSAVSCLSMQCLVVSEFGVSCHVGCLVISKRGVSVYSISSSQCVVSRLSVHYLVSVHGVSSQGAVSRRLSAWFLVSVCGLSSSQSLIFRCPREL